MRNLGDYVKMSVDGHDVYAMSRYAVYSLRPGKPYIIISVTDPESRDANLPNDPNCKAVLRLSFDDLTQVDARESSAIWSFVQKHWDHVGAVVCHCELGISRSPAIAAAITKAKGGRDDFWFVHCSPNKNVYYKVLEAAFDAEKTDAYGVVSGIGGDGHYRRGRGRTD